MKKWGEKMTRMSITEYMEKYKIKSRQTVYNKIQNGEIKSEKEGNRVYILEMEDLDIKTDKMDIIFDTIKYLEQQNGQLNEEKIRLFEEKKELLDMYKSIQYRQDELNKVILQIEYKKSLKEQENEKLKEEMENIKKEMDNIKKELEKEKQKKWYQRIFKK